MAKHSNNKVYFGMTTTEKEKLFTGVFKENKDIIFRLCYTSLNNKDDVDDLFQEVMINVWRSLENFRYESRISTWLYRITVNTALLYNKRFKTKSNRFMNTEPLVIDENHQSDDPFQNNNEEELKILHKAISQLKKQDRIIIGLFLEDMSYEEISEIVGISVNYVGVKINRIKTLLAKSMEDVK